MSAPARQVTGAAWAHADRLLAHWQGRGFEAIYVRDDGRACPAMLEDLDDRAAEIVETWLIGADGAREALARAIASGWPY